MHWSAQFAMILTFFSFGAAPALGVEVEFKIPDHAKLLDQDFPDGPSVTMACLQCHEEAARDFMQTTHWTWSAMQTVQGFGEVQYGKRQAVNNFCIGLAGNEPRCTSCHAGYGWKDSNFDFTDPTRVDCLVCHDRTGEYKKVPTGAGLPDPNVNLSQIAANVGAPTRENCGACHFFGGGGNGVKHGDLDTSLISPRATLDVHMGVDEDGGDFLCQDCHETERHHILGNAMVASPGEGSHFDCADCHDATPHEDEDLDFHTASVACQTCHIPEFARGDRPTKVYWDWSTAGQDHEVVNDEYGMPLFAKKKGHFKWSRDIVPAYAWYSNKAAYYRLGDPIDPTEVTKLNWPIGSKDDPESKIYPFKLHRGRQIYDTQTKSIINPKLFGPGGFWKTWDWAQASALGMEAAGQEFSGEYGFADTIMYWRINHMVAPADEALACPACHSKRNGRLDWEALGYEAGDPRRHAGTSRIERDD